MKLCRKVNCSHATGEIKNAHVKLSTLRQKMLDAAHADFGRMVGSQAAETGNVRKSLDAWLDVHAETIERKANAELSAAQRQVKKGKRWKWIGNALSGIGTIATIYWIATNINVPFHEKVVPSVMIACLFVAAHVGNLFLRNSKEKNYVNAVELAKKAESLLDEAMNNARKMAKESASHQLQRFGPLERG